MSVGCGRLEVESVKGAAANAGLRLYQSAVPAKRLLPDLVVALITPPLVLPYSAENADVCTVNSRTVSGEMLATTSGPACLHGG